MNKSGYNIDEERLKQRFAEFRVHYEEVYWQNFEPRLSELKIQSNFSLGSINKVWLILPLLAGALGASAVYFYSNPIRFSSSTTVNASPPLEESPPPEPKKETVVKVNAVLVSVPPTKDTAKLQPSNVAAEKKTVANIVKKDSSILTAAEDKPKDSSHAKADEQLLNDSNTSGEHHESAAHKKKKKKKKRNPGDPIESLRSNTLVPNSSDDDVVVPSVD